MAHPDLLSEPDNDPIEELVTTYSELNSSSITELGEVPSALEFMRYVSLNRPFVVRGGASEWKATQTWDVGTLKELLRGQSVNVAITPEGNADSPTKDPQNGELLFVKPWEEQQKFEEFIEFVSHQERSRSMGETVTEVRYAQTPLEQVPEAINLWIGNSLSTTALHKDNYENIYVQIIGQKHFVLLPPLAYACVNERELSPSSYKRREDGSLAMMKEDGEKVPFAIWDPDKEDNETRYSQFAKPTRVTLEKGDMLYLPALWYHKVSQSCSDEGICCAANYWFDMEFGGSFYPLCNYARSSALKALKAGAKNPRNKV